MNDALAMQVLGRGAVSPVGIGVAALTSEGPAPERSIHLPSTASRSVPVYSVDLAGEHWNRWKQEPRLRRASPIALFMAEAAAQALAEYPAAKGSRLGLVAAFGTGSIVFSRRFFSDFKRQGQKFASPALFPETVYNSPASHLAALLGIDGASYSIAGDESAWVEALRIARLWLTLDEVDYVLVVGAEELDPIAVEAFHRAGWFRGQSKFRPSEGTAAILLGRNSEDQKGVFKITQARTGWSFRNSRQAQESACAMAATFDPQAPAFRSARNNWLASIEAMATHGMTGCREFCYAGEAFAASAGWNLLRAASLLHADQRKISLPIWGLNQQHAWIELESTAELAHNSSRQKALPDS